MERYKFKVGDLVELRKCPSNTVEVLVANFLEWGKIYTVLPKEVDCENNEIMSDDYVRIFDTEKYVGYRLAYRFQLFLSFVDELKKIIKEKEKHDKKGPHKDS